MDQPGVTVVGRSPLLLSHSKVEMVGGDLFFTALSGIYKSEQNMSDPKLVLPLYQYYLSHCLCKVRDKLWVLDTTCGSVIEMDSLTIVRDNFGVTESMVPFADGALITSTSARCVFFLHHSGSLTHYLDIKDYSLQPTGVVKCKDLVAVSYRKGFDFEASILTRYSFPQTYNQGDLHMVGNMVATADGGVLFCERSGGNTLVVHLDRVRTVVMTLAFAACNLSWCGRSLLATAHESLVCLETTLFPLLDVCSMDPADVQLKINASETLFHPFQVKEYLPFLKPETQEFLKDLSKDARACAAALYQGTGTSIDGTCAALRSITGGGNLSGCRGAGGSFPIRVRIAGFLVAKLRVK
jgi:hypothetical protein